jgi:NAD(P)-dependent dehydrogenase (short-subunit alcohol dehydrogenase family)
MSFSSELFSLKNRTVVLTGSAGRLGNRFAHVLSQAGADVVLLDINKSENKKLEKELSDLYKTNPTAYTIDINKPKKMQHLTKKIISKYSKIDVLINNAHSVPRKNPKLSESFEKFPDDIWEVMVTETLRGLFFCSREIGNVMSKQNRGVIINISSIYGLVGPDQRIYGTSKLNSPVAYSVTKGGVVNMTRYLASYWHGKNIRVNTLTLGGVHDKKLQNPSFVKNYSKRTILGRMASKNDFDGALLFLASDASSYMTGANLVIDGGWTAW